MQQFYSCGALCWVSKGLSVAFLGCLIGLLACSKKQEELYHIPKEADFVVAINMQSMALKSFDLKALLGFFQQKRTAEESALAERIQNSGIDLLSTAYLFGEAEGKLENSDVTFLVPLSDAGKFEAFLKKEKGQLAGEESGLKFFIHDSLVVGWTPKTALVAIQGKATLEAVKKRLVAISALAADQSLAESDDYFNTLRKKSFDVLFWADASKAGKAAPTLPGGAFKDNYFGAVLNFEKGEVVMDGSFVTQNQAFTKYADLMDAKVDKSFVQAVPTPTPLGAFALKLNLSTVKKMLKDNNLLSTTDQTVQMLGMNTEEVLNMLSGDLVVSVVNIPDSTSMIPEMYVSLGIANQSSLKKLIANFKNQGFLTEQGRYLGLTPMPALALIPQEDKLVLTSTPALRETILSGKGDRLNSTAASSLEAGAMSFYFDYQAMAAKPALTRNQPEAQVFANYLNSFHFSALQTSGTTTDAKFIVTLKDKEHNSLVTLAKMSQELNALREKKKLAAQTSNDTMDTEVDSTVTVADTTAAQ